MLEVVRIRFEDRADFDRWQGYVHAQPDSHCSDLAQWRLLYHDLYGIENHSYVCLDEQRVVGAFSLYHIRSPLMGKMLVSCPFFGYGGCYWDNDAARDALLERASAVATELKVDYLEFRLTRELPSPFQTNSDFSEFHLEFEPTPEETWNRRLRSNVRQNIRKARKTDLEFRISTGYEPCWELLRRSLRAHGTPFHGERFFRLLTDHLGDRVRFSEVRLGDRVVAAGIVIRFKDTIITPYIGSLTRFRDLRANYLQYWGIIEHFAAAGVTRFDMGRSPRGSTHASFKKKWGCAELPVAYGYRVVDPRKEYRSVSQPTSVQRLATQVWRRLPLGLTTLIGPRLFRYIP